MTPEENMQLMQTLDDAYNARDWDTYAQRHKPDVVVRQPGQPPTHGVKDHVAESVQLVKTFDSKAWNRPYKTIFASGDWTCSIARATGAMTGPLLMADGTKIPPTGKPFELELCTVARWDDGQIVEENIFYDQTDLMRQIGLSS
jgi:ketosteroid isomerase-like protein